jgi:predicted nuclease of predicted toxin-antitoxin system
MKFMIDRCVGKRLADWLRDEKHDVVESRERGPDPGDRTLLEWAASEQRILVTMDKDFGALVFVGGVTHAGLVRLPDVPSIQRIEIMGRLLQDHSSALADRAVVTVRGERIRISRQP